MKFTSADHTSFKYICYSEDRDTACFMVWLWTDGNHFHKFIFHITLDRIDWAVFQSFVVKGQERWEFFKWKCFWKALLDFGVALQDAAAMWCSSRLWLAGVGIVRLYAGFVSLNCILRWICHFLARFLEALSVSWWNGHQLISEIIQLWSFIKVVWQSKILLSLFTRSKQGFEMWGILHIQQNPEESSEADLYSTVQWQHHRGWLLLQCNPHPPGGWATVLLGQLPATAEAALCERAWLLAAMWGWPPNQRQEENTGKLLLLLFNWEMNVYLFLYFSEWWYTRFLNTSKTCQIFGCYQIGRNSHTKEFSKCSLDSHSTRSERSVRQRIYCISPLQLSDVDTLICRGMRDVVLSNWFTYVQTPAVLRDLLNSFWWARVISKEGAITG